jgi:nicotinamide-nucleotide amidase
MVCVCVSGPGGAVLERTLQLPGDRGTVRDRTTTAVMHLVRRALLAGGTAAAA